MGLDMYLERHTYVKNWDHMTPEERYTITVSRGGKPVSDIDPTKISYIVEQVAYWRKANAIHTWFVQHVQNDNDDCGHYEVSREQLGELLDSIYIVLAHSELVRGTVSLGTMFQGTQVTPIRAEGQVIQNSRVAEELLPTGSGFFFGSTDYDEYYIEQLRYTKTVLEDLLSHENDRSIYYYHSSW